MRKDLLLFVFQEFHIDFKQSLVTDKDAYPDHFFCTWKITLYKIPTTLITQKILINLTI